MERVEEVERGEGEEEQEEEAEEGGSHRLPLPAASLHPGRRGSSPSPARPLLCSLAGLVRRPISAAESGRIDGDFAAARGSQGMGAGEWCRVATHSLLPPRVAPPPAALSRLALGGRGVWDSSGWQAKAIQSRQEMAVRWVGRRFGLPACCISRLHPSVYLLV